MFDQKFLFKSMLWSLGLTALLGVAAVLTASFDVIGRVIATTMITSATCGFLWQASMRLEQCATAIKISHTGAILFYIFALCGIWQIGNEEKVWVTSFICLGCFTIAAAGWSLQRQKGYHLTGLIASVASTVSGLCWLISVWGEEYGGRIAATGFAIAGWSAATGICLIGLGTEPSRHWRWIGVAAAVGGLFLSEVAIYRESMPKWHGDSLFVLGSITVVVIHAVLCYASQAVPSRMTIRMVAIVTTIISAILADVIVIQSLDGDRFILRLTIATVIVASTSTIATAFLIQRHAKQSRLASDVASESDMSETSDPGSWSAIKIECPKCQQLSTISVGISKCAHCGLKFKVEILSDL